MRKSLGERLRVPWTCAAMSAAAASPASLLPLRSWQPAEAPSGGTGCPIDGGTGTDVATLPAIRMRSMVLSSLARMGPAERREWLDSSSVMIAVGWARTGNPLGKASRDARWVGVKVIKG